MSFDFEVGNFMSKEKIAVMYGGRSAEHEISIITALQSIRAIDPRKYEAFPIYLALNGKWYTGNNLLEKSFYRQLPQSLSLAQEVTLLPDPCLGGFTCIPSQKIIPVDICLLAFHGQFGEDGCVQGLLELADLPFTGCGISAASLAMNKYLCKKVVQAHGIATLPSILVQKEEAISDLEKVKTQIFQTLQFPLFIKPNNLGSSIGIGKASTMDELLSALAQVFQYDDKALIEPCLENILEMNVAILDGNPPLVSLIEVPIASSGPLSYQDKYLRKESKTSGSQSTGMAALSRLIDPPNLDEGVKVTLRERALKAFKVLGCGGVCRFDFMMDLNKGALYFNEVNSIPGSFSFYLWDKLSPGILFTDLLERLIEKAKEKKSLQRSLNREFGFHAL